MLMLDLPFGNLSHRRRTTAFQPCRELLRPKRLRSYTMIAFSSVGSPLLSICHLSREPSKGLGSLMGRQADSCKVPLSLVLHGSRTMGDDIITSVRHVLILPWEFHDITKGFQGYYGLNVCLSPNSYEVLHPNEMV